MREPFCQVRDNRPCGEGGPKGSGGHRRGAQSHSQLRFSPLHRGRQAQPLHLPLGA